MANVSDSPPGAEGTCKENVKMSRTFFFVFRFYYYKHSQIPHIQNDQNVDPGIKLQTQVQCKVYGISKYMY